MASNRSERMGSRRGLAGFVDSLRYHEASRQGLGLLLLRAALSQMDVPTRSAFVMAVVTPAERAAAASFTAVPRSLASALSPSLGGAPFAPGWLAAPRVVCGALNIAYDLALLKASRGSKMQP